MGFFTGEKSKFEQRSLLGPEQMPLYRQLLAALQSQGAGGAFGDVADYYRSLFDDDNSTLDALSAPELRRFNQDIIPGLAEQFAGMGSGALASSGFRNAAVNAGADLSERLAAMRAGLRQQGAAGLSGLANQGLGQFNENIYRPATPGFLQSIAPGIGQGIGQGIGSLFQPKP